VRYQRWVVGIEVRFAIGIALVVPGCASSDPLSEPLVSHCSPIVGGALDPEHAGIVAVLGPDGTLVCSGTLIRAEQKPAVLTAAHCFRDLIAQVAVGIDYHAEDRLTYEISELAVHPQFDEETGEFDFGVLMLEGAVDPTWVVPVLSPQKDELATNTPIQFVGYGSTGASNTNTRLNVVDGTITRVTATSFYYLQVEGGPCAGDSGGPALVDLDGWQFLAGVTSHGDGKGCWSFGVSARVSAATEFLDALGLFPDACPPKNQQGTEP
jgi:secreted trypsin-like serine protease